MLITHNRGRYINTMLLKIIIMLSSILQTINQKKIVINLKITATFEIFKMAFNDTFLIKHYTISYNSYCKSISNSLQTHFKQ